MTTIAELRPIQRQRVMDLIEMAGLDVSDWANFEGGREKAAANPKYCYEWSFVEPGKVVVLNLWHAAMKEHDGVIFQELNQREVALRYERPPRKPAWARRARKSDLAIQTAFREKLPVRVVICDGDMRDIENDDSEASKVESRMLDPIPWRVTAYEWTTGSCTVTRGATAEPFVDQFDLDSEPVAPPERRTVSGEAFVRSAEVRRRVLLRANGVCEFCSQPGFKMPDGRVFLETHHVMPLAAGGLDIDGNVVALCPNHHREAHYGVTAPEMRKQLIIKAGATGGCR